MSSLSYAYRRLIREAAEEALTHDVRINAAARRVRAWDPGAGEGSGVARGEWQASHHASLVGLAGEIEYWYTAHALRRLGYAWPLAQHAARLAQTLARDGTEDLVTRIARAETLARKESQRR